LRRLLIYIVSLASLLLTAGLCPSVASADPNPDLTPAREFPIDCGDAGTYKVVFVESHLGTFHVIDSTSIFQSTSLTIEGELIFAEPGFTRNGRDQVTCTFTGASTGRQFIVTRFFTGQPST
jgi:hypothetical protein